MVIDKDYCMSSYIAFRYIADEDIDFYANMHHRNYQLLPDNKRIRVKTASEIDYVIKEQMEGLKAEKLGILLSGGMDSAILASYMSGCDAYTFRFGDWQKEELERAKLYADYYGLRLHYVDINWDTIVPYVDDLMRAKGAPVHSIEPQILKAALQAKNDGIERIVIGDAADYIFGGMDKLLAKDWSFDDFVKRYYYIQPEEVLCHPKDMSYIFEAYREGDKIDFIAFLDKYAAIESYGSYKNAFDVAGVPYTDCYEVLMMEDPLDLARIRNGESKYLIRKLFSMKYPQIPIPNKNPMPRPVDMYFRNWNGPSRREFRQNMDMDKFTGNQKWLMWCLERFLNLYEG